MHILSSRGIFAPALGKIPSCNNRKTCGRLHWIAPDSFPPHCRESALSGPPAFHAAQFLQYTTSMPGDFDIECEVWKCFVAASRASSAAEASSPCCANVASWPSGPGYRARARMATFSMCILARLVCNFLTSSLFRAATACRHDIFPTSVYAVNVAGVLLLRRTR